MSTRTLFVFLIVVAVVAFFFFKPSISEEAVHEEAPSADMSVPVVAETASTSDTLDTASTTDIDASTIDAAADTSTTTADE